MTHIGKGNDEGRLHPFRTLHGDGPPMYFDGLFHNAQAQARSRDIAYALAAEKHVKQPGSFVLRNSPAFIADGEQDLTE
jgi:hypothetical protein